MAIVRPQIDNAIASAMYEWVDPFEKTINKVAEELPNEGRMRPELLGDGTYEDEVGSNYVTITNITQMQGTDYGIPEVDFVEEGLENYNMPYARPFMEDAGKEFAEGEGSSILQRHLNSL